MDGSKFSGSDEGEELSPETVPPPQSTLTEGPKVTLSVANVLSLPDTCVMGIDVGTTSVKVAIVARSGEVRPSTHTPACFPGLRVAPPLEACLHVCCCVVSSYNPELACCCVGDGHCQHAHARVRPHNRRFNSCGARRATDTAMPCLLLAGLACAPAHACGADRRRGPDARRLAVAWRWQCVTPDHLGGPPRHPRVH